MSGWNLIAGQEIPAETVSYLTLISMDKKWQAFTTRIAQRMPGSRGLNTHKLPSDQRAFGQVSAHRASLNGVHPGKYEIGIDTRIGSSCLRALSKKVIVIAQQ